MSDQEGFLSRWSRRKREGAEPEPEAPDDSTRAVPVPEAGTGDDDGVATSASKDSPVVDLTKLPSIESIEAGTDIRGFLTQGVPAELSRAALRRAWVADPAIRDFVGLADYAWDFNAPQSMPGFGPMLPTDDVRRLLAEAMGEIEPEQVVSREETIDGVVPSTTINASGNDQKPAIDPKVQSGSDEVPPAADGSPHEDDPLATITKHPQDNIAAQQENIAMQKVEASKDGPLAHPRPSHGGALPE